MLQEDVLDRIANGLANDHFAVIDNFLPIEIATKIRSELKKEWDEENFKRAGIGITGNVALDKSVRGDHIMWLNNPSRIEAVNTFFTYLQDVVDYLNRSLYVGVKDFESHFTVYPPGTFYKRHLDQFKVDSHRVLSFLLYLNQNYTHDHEGELVLYKNSGEERIAPIFNRFLVFRSDLLEHEVLETKLENRISITGWMLNTPLSLRFLG